MNKNRVTLQLVDEKENIIKEEVVTIQGSDFIVCKIPERIINTPLTKRLAESILSALKSTNPGVILLPEYVDFKVLRKRIYHDKKKEESTNG